MEAPLFLQRTKQGFYLSADVRGSAYRQPVSSRLRLQTRERPSEPRSQGLCVMIACPWTASFTTGWTGTAVPNSLLCASALTWPPSSPLAKAKSSAKPGARTSSISHGFPQAGWFSYWLVTWLALEDKIPWNEILLWVRAGSSHQVSGDTWPGVLALRNQERRASASMVTDSWPALSACAAVGSQRLQTHLSPFVYLTLGEYHPLGMKIRREVMAVFHLCSAFSIFWN